MLLKLPIKSSIEAIPENLRQSYEGLAKMGLVDADELNLLEGWLGDLAAMK
jgi:hypothetical protein